MADDYLDTFLDVHSKAGDNETIDDLPSWVDQNNASYSAYRVINELKAAKLRYIHGHSKKTDYTKKSHYSISKAEVAKRIGKTAQSIFHASAYSSDLSSYFDKVNNNLLEAKNKKLERKPHGLQHLSKEELKSKTRNASEELTIIKQSNCEELYTRLLNDMTLDVKRTLGLC